MTIVSRHTHTARKTLQASNRIVIPCAAIMLSLLFASCNSGATREKELELKERELALKEKELALTAQTKGLDRATAEKQIRAKYQLPTSEIMSLTVYEYSQSSLASTFKPLADEGLLTYQLEGPDQYNHSSWRAQLTDKGRQYAVSAVYGGNQSTYEEKIDLKGAELDFDQITGIIEKDANSTAEVTYTLKRKNVTPFGKIAFHLGNGVSVIKTVSFSKYDDGWRIGN